MATNFDGLGLTKGVGVNATDTPLDVRTRVNDVSEI